MATLPQIKPGLFEDNTLNDGKYDTGLRNLQYFEAYYQPIYKDKLITGYSFAFLTKPKLFINPTKPSDADNPNDYLAYQNMCNDPFFSLFLTTESFNDSDKELIYNLSYKNIFPLYNTRQSNFIKLFTNEFRNFDPIDVNLDSNSDTFSTKEGYTFPLPTHSTVSRGTGTLSFQMDETPNMDITKLLALWVKYIENVTNGTFRANPEMIQNGELDYMSSMYYFVLGPDGKTIKYYCKYTGCYPTAIPYGAFNYSKGDKAITSVTVPFTYILKEDMNPQILEDFNRLSLNQLYLDPEQTNSEFYSYRDSELLSYNKLTNGLMKDLVIAEDRDPLIFFIEAPENYYLGDSFQLSFSNADIENPFFKNRYDEYDFDIYKI